jgi:hypothetical protein
MPEPGQLVERVIGFDTGRAGPGPLAPGHPDQPLFVHRFSTGDPKYRLSLGPPGARLVHQIGPAGVEVEMPSADVVGGDHRPQPLGSMSDRSEAFGVLSSYKTLTLVASAKGRPLSSAQVPMSDVWKGYCDRNYADPGFRQSMPLMCPTVTGR